MGAKQTDTEFTARVMAAAQRLKSQGYADVASFLAAAELQKRVAQRPLRKRGIKVRFSHGQCGTMDADLLKHAVEKE